MAEYIEEHGQPVWVGEQIDVDENGLLITMDMDIYCEEKHAIRKLCENYLEHCVSDQSKEVPMLVELSDE